jgi:hypothetical protein
MRRFLGLALVGVLVAVPAAVRAQTCGGMASFSTGPFRAGGGVGLANSVTNFNANLNAGSQYGPFGGVSVGRSDVEGAANSGTVLGLDGGYSFELNPRRTAKFCPIAGFTYTSGPDVGAADSSSRSVSFGGSFGGLIHTQSTVTLAPFVSASFIDLKRTRTVRSNGNSTSASDQYGLITVGSGFVLNRILTIQPAVAFPVAVDPGFRDDAIFSLAFGVNFGGPRARPATTTATPARPK